MSDAQERAVLALIDQRLDPLSAAAARSLIEAGERRAASLRQLQLVAAVLARTLDEEVILTEVARAMSRALADARVLVAEVRGDPPGLTGRRHVDAAGDLPAVDLPLDMPALREGLLSGTVWRLSREREVDAPALDDWQRVVGEADALVLAPMMQGRKLLGALIAYAPGVEAYGDDAAEFALTLATTTGAALQTARLYAESERERRQSDAMAEVARAAGESLRITEVQRLILRHAMALLGAEGAALTARDGEYLHIEAALGASDILAGVVLPVHGSLTGQVVTTGEAVITNAAEEEPGAHLRTLRLAAIRETLIVPLRTARGIVGTLGVMNRASGFSAADARILQRLADQVAVAIVNARLFADIQESTREWQSTFDAIGMGMAVVNDEGRVLRCNARARQLAGDETTFAMLGRPFYKAVLGLAAPPGDDPLHAAITEGTRMRATCVHADGVRRYEIVAVPHLDSGAVVTFDLVTGTDG